MAFAAKTTGATCEVWTRYPPPCDRGLRSCGKPAITKVDVWRCLPHLLEYHSQQKKLKEQNK